MKESLSEEITKTQKRKNINISMDRDLGFFFITFVLDESEVFSKYSYLHQLRKYARISDSVSK